MSRRRLIVSSDGPVDRVLCPNCKARYMRIRTSHRISETVIARLECTNCFHVLNATIQPAKILSIRPIERRQVKSDESD